MDWLVLACIKFQFIFRIPWNHLPPVYSNARVHFSITATLIILRCKGVFSLVVRDFAVDNIFFLLDTIPFP